MGGASAVSITNWQEMQTPLKSGIDFALHKNYMDIQGNADNWNTIFHKELEVYKEKKEKDLKEYIKQQEEAREKWLKNESEWRNIELAVIAAQKLIGLYFADKQYDAAKEAQDNQMEIWNKEKEWAERYQDLWFNKYRPVEEKLLKEKAEQEEYTPHYDEVQARAVTHTRREFARAREQARRCIDPHCIGMLCATNKELAIAEARTVVGEINKGYRAEEARKDIKDAQRDETIFSLLQLGRGLQTDSLNALNSAAEAAKVASSFHPYDGYETALGSLFGEARAWAGDRRVSAGNNADLISRQIGTYTMGLTPSRRNPYYQGGRLTNIGRELVDGQLY